MAKKKCDTCKGNGKMPDGSTCPACHGAGGIDTTTV